ncbi:response regulator [Anaeromyxobacter paludicola]|uniref:Response regulatory domain-containing protein n=1 Tax=Anaeromyxobacter paludicola TaxID=2918171 RepID=A0ABM7X5A9_9BACT|nr:response regulator [Anaeromyxobacter paludicola]BDG07005.1 hypothetical protein AMPC_01180 [Anaeromyxobacter paludicola]
MSPADRKLVLVVDDEPDLAALAAEILELEVFATVTARDGRQALSVLARTRPDVIVTDLMMPELDGFGFMAEYAARPGPRAPVLAVSAFDGFLARARAAGAADVLSKPYDADALVARVTRLCAAAGRGAGASGAPAAPTAAAPPDESARLREIFSLRLDEPAPTDALQRFSERVARLFDVPVCLVSIVTADRQYWHAFCGLTGPLAEARGTPREDSFCTHAVAARAALVVHDASAHPFFSANRLVRDVHLRFYAGVPLFNRIGEALGTLCILDFEPRAFGYFDLELLGVLAKRVVAELDWRERRRHPLSPPASFRYLDYLDEELDLLGREAFAQALEVESVRATERRAPLGLLAVALSPAFLRAGAERLKQLFPRAHLGRLGLQRLGVLAPGLTAAEAAALAASGPGPGARVEGVDVAWRVSGPELFLRDLEQRLGSAGLAPPLEALERG